SRSRPARASAVVLPQRASTAGGRSGTRCARARRVARARLGGRGGPRGAAPDPRAPAARECALRPARSLSLPPPARRQRRLLGAALRARPAHEPPARAARGPRAAGRRVGDARGRTAEAACEARAARARPALRGRGAASRPSLRARGLCARDRTDGAAARDGRMPRGSGRAGKNAARDLRGEGAGRLRAPVPGHARHRVAGGALGRRAAEATLAPEAADELRVLASFIRRPPPELAVIRLADSVSWR